MKTISVSRFKTYLSAALKGVADDGELVVLDHGHPIARVLPYRDQGPSGYRPASVAWEVRELPPLVAPGVAHDVLIEDRRRR